MSPGSFLNAARLSPLWDLQLLVMKNKTYCIQWTWCSGEMSWLQNSPISYPSNKTQANSIIFHEKCYDLINQQWIQRTNYRYLHKKESSDVVSQPHLQMLLSSRHAKRKSWLSRFLIKCTQPGLFLPSINYAGHAWFASASFEIRALALPEYIYTNIRVSVLRLNHLNGWKRLQSRASGKLERAHECMFK